MKSSIKHQHDPISTAGRPVSGSPLQKIRGFAAILTLSALALTGCGGGADTTANPDLGGSGGGASYTGIPQSDLVQRFAQEMWPNLSARCGTCHIAGGQPPEFAQLDINQAYNAAITVTNMGTPADSRLVSKVGTGHNCWLPNNSECGDVMTRWIENWIGGDSGGGRTITLNEPTTPDLFPGSTKDFPAGPNDSSPSFAATVYPLLDGNCSSCHQSNPTATGQLPIAPFFASDDVVTAYEAAKPKMDLDIPSNSRLVRRMNEGHNCFDADTGANGDICVESATALEQAITAFAGGISAVPPVIGNNTTISGAVDLSGCDGSSGCNIANGGNRYENNLLALYEFKAGSGNIVTDVSGAIGNPINLTLFGAEGSDYEWVGGYGVAFKSAIAKAQDTANTSGRLQQSIATSGEYSIEAWAIPGNVTQEDSNIVSYSGSGSERNFTLGQTMYNYDFLQRSTTTDNNGMPTASTPDADEVLQSSLQHVVVTYDPINGRRIYVNGAVTNTVDPVAPGGLGDWDGTIYPLVLGNEVDGSRPWSGTLRLVALHERALTHQQIVQNFEAGVGEKYYLLFGISHIDAAIPAGSYILFEFSQIDGYGYLFSTPTYVNLVDPATAPAFTIKGMRIGVNGKLPTAGQAFGKLDVTLGANYTPEEGEILSILGTVISLEKGIDQDEFFLAFDEIAGASNPFVEPTVTPPVPVEPPTVPDVGIRTFGEINASIAAITGVPETNTAVNGVYLAYKQQLPTVENTDGFLGSHQMAVAQLALTYCSELVDGNGDIPRGTYFAGFDFGQNENNAFNTQAKRDMILDPLMKRAMNIDAANGNLTSQPVEQEIRDMMSATTAQDLDAALTGDAYNSLIQHMIVNCAGGSCNSSARTAEIVKGTCAAVVGGAVMLVQ